MGARQTEELKTQNRKPGVQPRAEGTGLPSNTDGVVSLIRSLYGQGGRGNHKLRMRWERGHWGLEKREENVKKF